jgi:hypothetical protein
MATDIKPGGTVRVTISKTVTRDAARKTLERLFMRDRAVAGPIERRSRNFKEIPKRRGGQIWTKRPNKVHPDLGKGATAVVAATPQHLRDLKSVESFVSVAKA